MDQEFYDDVDFTDLVTAIDNQMAAATGQEAPEPLEPTAVSDAPEEGDPLNAEPQVDSGSTTEPEGEPSGGKGDTGAEVRLLEDDTSALVTVGEKLLTVKELVENFTASGEAASKLSEVEAREKALAGRSERSQLDERILDAVRTNPVDTAIMLLEQNPTLAASRGVSLPTWREAVHVDDETAASADPWAPVEEAAAQARAGQDTAMPAWAQQLQQSVETLSRTQAEAERRRQAEASLKSLPEKLGVSEVDTEGILRYAVDKGYGDLVEAGKAFMFDKMQSDLTQAQRREAVGETSIPPAAREAGVVTSSSRTPRAAADIDVSELTLEEVIRQTQADMLGV